MKKVLYSSKREKNFGSDADFEFRPASVASDKLELKGIRVGFKGCFPMLIVLRPSVHQGARGKDFTLGESSASGVDLRRGGERRRDREILVSFSGESDSISGDFETGR